MSGMSVENINKFSSRFHPVVTLLRWTRDEKWKKKKKNPQKTL